jgi:hypothetical protein
VADHSINVGHHSQFHDIVPLVKNSRCTDCLITEVIEIEHQSDNMNREEGFFLSRSWKPLIHILKE